MGANDLFFSCSQSSFSRVFSEAGDLLLPLQRCDMLYYKKTRLRCTRFCALAEKRASGCGETEESYINVFVLLFYGYLLKS